MSAIKMVLGVIAIAALIQVGEVSAAETTRTGANATGVSAVGAAKAGSTRSKSLAGPRKPVPSVDTDSLDNLLWSCASLPEPGETLSDCIARWDFSEL